MLGEKLGDPGRESTGISVVGPVEGAKLPLSVGIKVATPLGERELSFCCPLGLTDCTAAEGMELVEGRAVLSNCEGAVLRCTTTEGCKKALGEEL